MTTSVKWVIMKITDEPAILVLQVQLEMGVSYMGGGYIKKIQDFVAVSYRIILMTHSAQNFAKSIKCVYIYKPHFDYIVLHLGI